MIAGEEKVLGSPDRYGRIAIVCRTDGLFCLCRRWRDGHSEPLPGIYGAIADAERNALQLLQAERGREFAGMTVNERLSAAGLMEAFDAAAEAHNRAGMIDILIEIGLEDASATADSVLKKFGC